MSNHTWNKDDQRNSSFIALLLFVAKISEKSKRKGRVPLTAEQHLKAAEQENKEFQSLIKTAIQMFPADGEMEKSVVTFAKTMGYEVEQHQIPQGAKTPQ